MTDERKFFVLTNTLKTIMLESKEPNIKAMAESALQETANVPKLVDTNNHCKSHNWFGAIGEKCPMCSCCE